MDTAMVIDAATTVEPVEPAPFAFLSPTTPRQPVEAVWGLRLADAEFDTLMSAHGLVKVHRHKRDGQPWIRATLAVAGPSDGCAPMPLPDLDAELLAEARAAVESDPATLAHRRHADLLAHAEAVYATAEAEALQAAEEALAALSGETVGADVMALSRAEAQAKNIAVTMRVRVDEFRRRGRELRQAAVERAHAVRQQLVRQRQRQQLQPRFDELQAELASLVGKALEQILPSLLATEAEMGRLQRQPDESTLEAFDRVLVDGGTVP